MTNKASIFKVLAVLSLATSACDAKDGESAAQIAGTSGTEPTTAGPVADTEDPPSTSPVDDDGGEESSTTDAPSETEGDTEPGCAFLGCGETDDNREVFGCDLWGQDCPSGEKCMPWANDGGPSWNGSRCSPVDASPGQPGDPCMVEGSGVSGVDSCDVGSMCWNVDEENAGTCVSLCQGSPENTLCDNPADVCIVANDGALPLCLPQCDPLLGCADGEGCYPGAGGFVCIPDASGPDLGAYGDACEYVNACDPGLFCGASTIVPGCEGSGCCTDFCDLDDPEPSAGCGGLAGGQECISAFDEGQAQPGLEDVGVCAIPE
ncbi:MAG: ribulose phosphate epimerase [Nannocystales bacterium]